MQEASAIIENIRLFRRQRLASAWFFAAPAVAYGIFTSRLPALRQTAMLDDAALGSLLLALGIATLCGLLAASALADRLGAARISGMAATLLAIGMTIACMAHSFFEMAAFCVLAGIGVGFCDVGMNALGIDIERRFGMPCLNFLHGASSLGAVVGSMSGQFCARADISPFYNILIVMAVFMLALPWAMRHAPQAKSAGKGAPPRPAWHHVAFLVYFCGMLGLICHIAEGSVGSWGSILLHSVKGASREEAALVFAAFTAALAGCRFGADRLRLFVPDGRILFWGSLLAGAGMAVVLLSPWPGLCIVGYAAMGACIAPVAPILFSIAGQAKNASAAQASGIVSIFSYAGLLIFPPFFGMPGSAFGLLHSLWLIVCLCALLAFASLGLQKLARK